MMRTIRRAAACLSTAILAAASMNSMAQNTYTLPLVLSADNAGSTSFLRIINTTDESGTVQIHGIDDTGERFGPASLAIGANAVVNFTSRELERGNTAKGISSGVGDGEGNWRLEFTTALVIEPSVYIRTSDGFVTSMHDVAPTSGLNLDHYISFFNPGSNFRQVSRLRLVNPGSTTAEVSITGRDDAGVVAPGGTVRLTLPARTSRFLSAQTLESGVGLDGRLGDGTGKWRLSVVSNVAIQVMSILSTPTGHITNLSTSPLYVGMVTPTEPENPTTPTEIPTEPLNSFRECPACPLMMVLPSGSFLMGTPESQELSYIGWHDQEQPVHRVTIARPFAVGVYEVTFAEWDACVADGGCQGQRPYPNGEGRYPVINVELLHAKSYVAWLSEKTGGEYRLLSESEWEYAARAGTTGRFHTGATITTDQANIDGRHLLFPRPGCDPEEQSDCWIDANGLNRGGPQGQIAKN